MIGDVLGNASIVARVSMFMGLLPLGMGVTYAIWPSEQRLTVMRPLSLATIFAAIGGTVTGILNILVTVGRLETLPRSQIIAVGLAESLVPVFFGFGCLTVAWLCVAIGLWRRT